MKLFVTMAIAAALTAPFVAQAEEGHDHAAEMSAPADQGAPAPETKMEESAKPAKKAAKGKKAPGGKKAKKDTAHAE